MLLLLLSVRLDRKDVSKVWIRVRHIFYKHMPTSTTAPFTNNTYVIALAKIHYHWADANTPNVMKAHKDNKTY